MQHCKTTYLRLVTSTSRSGNPYWKGRLSTADLLVLTSLDPLLSILKTLFTFFYKTCYLNEEVNCTEPLPSVSVPCLDNALPGLKTKHFFLIFRSFLTVGAGGTGWTSCSCCCTATWTPAWGCNVPTPSSLPSTTAGT